MADALLLGRKAGTVAAAAPSNFLADVDAMFERAARHIPMQDGLLEKIRVCNETYVTRFAVRLRGRMFTFEGWRSVNANHPSRDR